MKKEVLVAILIGLGLGLIVTFGIYRAKTSLNSGQQAASTITDTSPSPSGSIHNSLTLLAPEDESVQATSDIKVTGATDPDAIVIVFVNNTPQVIRADRSGNFSIQTTLQQGSNVITVRTLDEEGNSAETQRTVIFTTVSLEDTSTASISAQLSPKPSPSPSSKPSPKPTVKPASPSPTTTQ